MNIVFGYARVSTANQKEDRQIDELILRCPIIPRFNDRRENYDEICRLANTCASIIGIEIEPYHTFGESKYDASGRHHPKIFS